MVRTTSKTLHPVYQEYLDETCAHLSETTLKGYVARLRVFPSPDKLTVPWFRERMKGISIPTAKAERQMIRKFKKWSGDNVEDWTSEMFGGSGRVKIRKAKPSVTEEDLYTREELEAIFAACIETRDRAMLMVLYESGVRLGELANMQFSHIRLDDNGSGWARILVPDTKTGVPRSPQIKDSVPALIAWMNVHPDKTGYLWRKLRFPSQRLNYHGVMRRITDIVEGAIERRPKRIVHMFRHSRATELRILGVPIANIEKQMGWVPGSGMIQRYSHLSGAWLEDNYRQAIDGTVIEKPQPMLVSGKCPRCGVGVSELDVVCAKCSFPLTSDGIKDAVESRSDLEARLADVEKLLAGLMPPTSPHDVDEEYEELKKTHRQRKQKK